MLASTAFDLAVIHANAALVTVALVACLYAYHRGNPRERWLRAAQIVTCAVYVISYLYLTLDYLERVVAWSRVMRGVSLVAWIVVWIAPPILDVQLTKKRQVILASMDDARVKAEVVAANVQRVTADREAREAGQA